jgi:putative flippase GtrA
MHHLTQMAALFIRYTAAGVIAFIFELILLNILLETSSLPYYASVGIAFTVSLTLLYVACHLWVFQRSGRKVPVEYGYFFLILVTGLLITLVIVTALVDLFDMNILLARMLSAVVSGTWGFYLNGKFNFRAHPFLRR